MRLGADDAVLRRHWVAKVKGITFVYLARISAPKSSARRIPGYFCTFYLLQFLFMFVIFQGIVDTRLTRPSKSLITGVPVVASHVQVPANIFSKCISLLPDFYFILLSTLG